MPSAGAEPGHPPGASERLLRRTARDLALMALLLIVALLAGVGLATAAVAIRTTDASVDRSLRDAATAAIAYLELVDVDASPTPAPTPTGSPTTNGSPVPTPIAGPTGESEPSGDGEGGQSPGPGATPTPATTNDGADQTEPDGRLAAPTDATLVVALAVVASPASTPVSASPAPFDLEPEDQPPAASDTFFLVLDAGGQLLANPRRVLLNGLPDATAAASAAANGEDWRTVISNGVPVRLFTKRVSDGHGGPPALLQSGMVLSLHEVERNEILMTILIASLLGLIGAGVVSGLVARRALAPIRSAFASERRFVAAASHELRTPVALVHALAEVLQREDLVKPAGRQMLDDMISETDRLGRLVGDLLALSSAEAGAFQLQRAPLEARGFVADLARRVEGVAAERGLKVEVVQQGADNAAELPLQTDSGRLAQLVLIFVDNALDHSPPSGTVRLIVSPTVEHGQPHVTIAVADQGPGVPVAERERIFEPFTRLARRNAIENGGTGLGLAIARSLADRLGATVRVGDVPGGGALFSVTLRRRPAGKVVGDTGFEPISPRT